MSISYINRVIKIKDDPWNMIVFWLIGMILIFIHLSNVALIVFPSDWFIQLCNLAWSFVIILEIVYKSVELWVMLKYSICFVYLNSFSISTSIAHDESIKLEHTSYKLWTIEG